MRQYTIWLAGPLPTGLLGELRGRWDGVDSVPEGPGTRLACWLDGDAGLRALLTVLWDANLTVSAVAIDVGEGV